MGISLPAPLLMLGAGKMGGALISGLVSRGVRPGDLVVQDPAPPSEVLSILDAHGISRRSGDEPWSHAVPPAVIVAAVKPQIMDAAFPGVAALAGPETLTLSIAAGKTLASFESYLKPGAAVVRAMPNTPAAIGHGMTVCCANGAATPQQRDLAGQLMAAVGDVAWVDDEGLMNAVTAVSGSGPAYVFHMVECMAEAGTAAGLPSDLAMQLARSTVAGSGALLAQSDVSAGQLRSNVTSPGGTTAAALEVLMHQDAMRDLFKRAILAATRRGEELAKGE